MNATKNIKTLPVAVIAGRLAMGLIFAAGALATTSAGATGTANSTFNVTATVLPSCLLSATNLAFGNYAGAQLDASTTLSVTCNALISVGAANIGLDPGASTGATVSTRKMNGALTATLGYALYRDSARTQNWGNTIGTDTYTGLVITALGIPASVTVYGRIAASQFVTPGTYSDVVTVTMTY